MKMERFRAWMQPRRKWLVPIICLILGSLLGGTVTFTPQEDPAPPEVEIWLDE